MEVCTLDVSASLFKKSGENIDPTVLLLCKAHFFPF